MNTVTSLADLIAAVNAHEGSWRNAKLALNVKMFLWARYDPNDDLVYPTIKHWDLLLLEVIASGSYASLSKDEVLSILFGLHHRNRIVDGLWESMFARGVTPKLLEQLFAFGTDRYE